MQWELPINEGSAWVLQVALTFGLAFATTVFAREHADSQLDLLKYWNESRPTRLALE